MRKPVVLITGAGGEIGHGLMARLAGTSLSIITLDVAPLDKTLAPLVTREFTGSIIDADLLDRLLAEFEVDLIFHLAALLSTRAEFTPMSAHHVNVDGTLNLLEFAQRQGESHGRSVVFLYPTTMYGCNKLYCEQLGRYYARHYKQLAARTASRRVDFRSVRLPGLI